MISFHTTAPTPTTSRFFWPPSASSVAPRPRATNLSRPKLLPAALSRAFWRESRSRRQPCGRKCRALGAAKKACSFSTTRPSTSLTPRRWSSSVRCFAWSWREEPERWCFRASRWWGERELLSVGGVEGKLSTSETVTASSERWPSSAL